MRLIWFVTPEHDINYNTFCHFLILLLVVWLQCKRIHTNLESRCQQKEKLFSKQNWDVVFQRLANCTAEDTRSARWSGRCTARWYNGSWVDDSLDRRHWSSSRPPATKSKWNVCNPVERAYSKRSQSGFHIEARHSKWNRLNILFKVKYMSRNIVKMTSNLWICQSQVLSDSSPYLLERSQCATLPKNSTA